jgi:hypothetical protein
MAFADKLKSLRERVTSPASNPIDRFRNLQTLDAFLANHAAETEALVRTGDAIGAWLSAAMDDPAVCKEMKADASAFLQALAALEDKQ